MIAPTQQQRDEYRDMISSIPFAHSIAHNSHLRALDVIPEPDSLGRRKVDGFKCAFECTVSDGQSKRFSSVDRGLISSQR